MCLAIPMLLKERREFDGTVELDGVARNVSLMLLPEAREGDWLLVHAGYAIGSVDESEAQETLAMLHELADHMEEI